MIELDGRAAISESLETHFGLKKYLDIIQTVRADDFSAGSEFRRAFNGYFKVRQRSGGWYDLYYGLMAEQKREARSFTDLLRLMAGANEVHRRVEVSFVSKLMAVVDPKLPIWDQYVLKNTGEAAAWHSESGKDEQERIERAGEIYARIQKKYARFLGTDRGRSCIALFDELLPGYRDELTDVKKLDFLLWSKR